MKRPSTSKTLPNSKEVRAYEASSVVQYFALVFFSAGHWASGSGVIKDFALDRAKSRVKELDKKVAQMSADVSHYESKAKEWKKKALQAEHDLNKYKQSKQRSINTTTIVGLTPKSWIRL